MKPIYNLIQLFIILIIAPQLKSMGGEPASLTFNLNECTSFSYNGSNSDYSEFTAVNSSTPEIGLAVVGNNLYRLNPQVNQHSCTPGLNGTEAMCISYDPVCDYQPGSQRSLRFDISVNPLNGEPAQLQKLSFQEKSPVMFDWIAGPTGLNNYPLKYGVRISKNDVVIYEQGEFMTSNEWSLEQIGFDGNQDFIVTEPTTFNFELLAYCPVGMMAMQSVWDVEDITITAGCVSNCSAAVDGGNVSLANGQTNFNGCVGDIVLDVTNTSISDATNYYYVITEANDNILAYVNSSTTSTLDLSGAPAGECHIWGWSRAGSADPVPGNNINSLNDDACEAISNNFITVVRGNPSGGTLTGGPFEFCVGDNVADNIPSGAIVLSGSSGTNSQWVVTDEQGNILGLPPMPTAVDFDGAGIGTCLIWHLSFENGLTGASMGNNAMTDLVGCYSLSNSISVNRTDCSSTISGGIIEGGPFAFCVGDGSPDNVSGITLSGNNGTNNQWVVTDDQGNILGLPPMPSVVDFDGAGAGVCLIWNISYDTGLIGLMMGNNVSSLTGNFGLSNSITVTRTSPQGGTLTGGPFEFCVGDGTADNIPANGITLTGNSGTNSQWVVTDDQGNILGLPPTFSAPDFDGAPAGTCLIWHLSYENGLVGAEMGLNANNLQGCFSLSNPITVVRTSPQGGTLTGGPFEFCVGDGVADNIPANGITLTGNSGTNSQWVVTDDQGNILGLPPTFSAPDFDGAPVGTCLIWHLSYENGLVGAEMGLNANNLQGCFSLSNPITVVRTSPQGGTLTGGPFEFCVGDGTADNIPANGITLTGNSGTNSQWVITDDQGNILGLPPTFSAPDFDGAPAGTCLIWHLSYENGLVGAEMGLNANNLQGCFSLSNPITVVRTSPQGGTLTGGPFEFCVGDGIADNIPANGITLTGNSGTNSQWVVTDDQGNILGLPPTFSAPDFDGAPAGTCLIWHLSYENGLVGAEMGLNANNLQGCFSLSNPITVVRTSPQGGTLTGGPFEFCVGDGTADNIPANGITLTGNTGTNSQWVVTDDQGNILGLPPTFSAPDFDGAPVGTCLIWHLSYENGLVGAEMGLNANNLQGCFSLSNPITVVRTSPQGGTLTGGPFEFCVGDGTADNIPANGITLTGNSGTNSQWVVTDDQGNILGLPPTFSAPDFDGAPVGTCLIWHLSYENGLVGAEMGLNANNLQGCFSLSNPITVVRTSPQGGTLTGGPFEFCVGDGVADNIPANGITLTGNSGTNSQWVVTDDQGNILGLPPTFSAPDFDGAPAGTCLIWHLSYENGLVGAEMGLNANNLQGCFSLSNPITVVRTSPQGGTLTGGPFEFCVGDGIADNIPANGITLTGNSGTNSQWVVTDDQGNILGLPPTFSAPDFDGAPVGTCLIWHLSYENGLVGAEMGLNANNLQGCFSLSNPITVVRTSPQGGTLTGGPFEFCVGDGVADNIPANGITLTGNSGTNSQWVVTDDQGNILGLPPTFSAPDFDGAPAGTCLIWHLSYENGLVGAEMGLNANNLQGCFSLSNPITVVRTSPQGGTLTGGPFEFCVGDGIADKIPANGITLTGNTGTNSQWVVTDDQGNILGLPPTFSAPDFDGAPVGTCLIWHLSYEAGLTGLAMGMNANNLQGCFSLSNSISVIRNDCAISGGALAGGPFTFCVGDGVVDNVSGITLTGNTGTNNQWVVTDDQGMILGLPPMPSAVDFDGAGAGVCQIWNVSYETGLTGLVMGNNLTDLAGMFGISNAVQVNRNQPEGGTLSGGPFTFNLIGDGVADMIPAGSITINGMSGSNSQWLVTDSQGVILGLPPMPGAVDFDGAGSGTCLIWHLSYESGLEGLAVGMSATNLSGCYDLSNSIEVMRTNANGCNENGGELFGGPFNFIAGDGVMDTIAIDSFVLANNSGMNSQWLVTDSNGYILGLPPTPSDVNFDGAGYGTCLVWHLSYDTGLTGLEMGMNANDLQGCFSLSNAMTVNRTNASGCNTNGGALFGGPFDFCVGDGISDNIAMDAITLANNGGMNSQWIVTDDQGIILGLPPMPSDVDFDGAGVGTCLIWHLSYETGITGLAMGMNANNLQGCFSLSNSISVVRTDCPVSGGIVINEINSNNQIEIKNTGTMSVDISTYWLCNFPAYSQLMNLNISCGGDYVLDPGELVTVMADFNIDENDGELGLYNSASYTDPTAIIDYVEWGSSGHQRSSVAVSAGIWTTGDFVPAFSAPQVLEYDGTGDSSLDWSVDAASPCGENFGQGNTEFQFVVYPNPAIANISLEFNRSIEQDARIEIYDQLGQLQSLKAFGKGELNNNNLQIQNLEVGTYYLKVIVGREVKVQKFLKL